MYFEDIPLYVFVAIVLVLVVIEFALIWTGKSIRTIFVVLLVGVNLMNLDLAFLCFTGGYYFLLIIPVAYFVLGPCYWVYLAFTGRANEIIVIVDVDGPPMKSFRLAPFYSRKRAS